MLAVFAALLLASPPVATAFRQVSPSRELNVVARSDREDRAVLLMHGLRGSAVREKDVYEAYFHDWQRPDSAMVRVLGKDSDVYSFAYGQNASLPEIGAMPMLGEAVAGLVDLGYSEIVIVAHSAGGVLARTFVEDHPEAGVTKVIQVCSPNLGSKFGRAGKIGRSPHEAFIASLSDRARAAALASREEKTIPDTVEFVCVIGDGGGIGDFVVQDDSQWPPDLRAIGVPAIQVRTAHFVAMRSEKVAATIAQLVREGQPRWSAAKVEEHRADWLQTRPHWNAAGSP